MTYLIVKYFQLTFKKITTEKPSKIVNDREIRKKYILTPRKLYNYNIHTRLIEID